MLTITDRDGDKLKFREAANGNVLIVIEAAHGEVVLRHEDVGLLRDKLNIWLDPERQVHKETVTVFEGDI